MSFSEKATALHQVMKKLDVGDASILRKVFAYSPILKQCYESRVDPVTYLSQTFKYPLTLMSAMFDSGCVITGPRALQFFLPESAQGESVWTFFVPGYKESVLDMVNVLEICGVTWNLDPDGVATSLRRLSTADEHVPSKVLACLKSWDEPLDSGKGKNLLGHDICASLKNYIESKKDDETKANIPIMPTDETHESSVEQLNKSSARDALSILHGHILTGEGVKEVELMIGSEHSGINSCMSFIKRFYASHVQCFIGGWCAAHMYYYQSKEKMSSIWRPWPGQKYQDAHLDARKYRNRGFTFHRAKRIGPITRSFRDPQAFLLEYGELYRSFLRPSHHVLLNDWLAERRDNIDGISWTEFDGRIFSVQDTFESCYRRSQMTFVSHSVDLPLDRLRRLSNLVALNTEELDKLRTEAFRSSVGPSAGNQKWHLAALVRTGKVFNHLRDATPWSWAL